MKVNVCAPSKRIKNNRTFLGRAKRDLISVNCAEKDMIFYLAEKERWARNAAKNQPKQSTPVLSVDPIAQAIAAMKAASNYKVR